MLRPCACPDCDPTLNLNLTLTNCNHVRAPHRGRVVDGGLAHELAQAGDQDVHQVDADAVGQDQAVEVQADGHLRAGRDAQALPCRAGMLLGARFLHMLLEVPCCVTAHAPAPL